MHTNGYNFLIWTNICLKFSHVHAYTHVDGVNRGVQIIRNSSHKKKGYIWAKFCVFSYSIILRTNGIDKL